MPYRDLREDREKMVHMQLKEVPNATWWKEGDLPTQLKVIDEKLQYHGGHCVCKDCMRIHARVHEMQLLREQRRQEEKQAALVLQQASMAYAWLVVCPTCSELLHLNDDGTETCINQKCGYSVEIPRLWDEEIGNLPRRFWNVLAFEYKILGHFLVTFMIAMLIWLGFQAFGPQHHKDPPKKSITPQELSLRSYYITHPTPDLNNGFDPRNNDNPASVWYHSDACKSQFGLTTCSSALAQAESQKEHVQQEAQVAELQTRK